MKIFSIRDETDNSQRDLGYLLYYEAEKRFYIELPDQADPWETPLLLSSFLKRGEKTVNYYWSKIWVQQRIVPSDRQNLGQILRDNGLVDYDEYALLLLSMGRCAQDDYYLVPLEPASLPEEIERRFQMRIEDIVPLAEYRLLVFFRDGTVRKCNLRPYFEQHKPFQILLSKPSYFENIQMQVGGHGVHWDEERSISDAELYRIGEAIPLCAEDFKSYVSHRVITAAEAAQLLNCSRQNVDELTRRNKLHPVKTAGKSTLYLKSEVLKRGWK